MLETSLFHEIIVDKTIYCRAIAASDNSYWFIPSSISFGAIKYYNEKRIKGKLGWVSPLQYRLNILAA